MFSFKLEYHLTMIHFNRYLKSDDMGTVGRDVILHVLIMDPSDNLSNLLVFRDILYVEMTITKVIVLVHLYP